MKHIIVLVTFLLGISTSEAQYRNSGHQKRGPHFAVKNNVLGYIIETYNFSFEYQIASKQSVQLVVKLFDRKESIMNTLGTGKEDDVYAKGFSLGGEYRLYLEKSEEDLRGLYLSPYIRYFSKDMTREPGQYTLDGGPADPVYFKRSIVSGGLMIGAQDIGKKSGLGIDIFIGAGFRQHSDRDIKGDLNVYEEEGTMLEFRLGANIVLSNA